MVGLLCGTLGAAVFSALGGVVVGEESCDVDRSGLSGTALLLRQAMDEGRFGSLMGLVVGFVIAAAGAFSGRRSLMAVDVLVIAAVAAGSDGSFHLLGSVLPSHSHDQCTSAAIMGGFIGASMGALVGIYLASKTLSPMLLLRSLFVVGAIAVPIALLLDQFVGWQ